MTPTPTPTGKTPVRPYRPAAGNMKRDINLIPANESSEKIAKTGTIILAAIVGLGLFYLVAVFWPTTIYNGLNGKVNAAQNQKVLLAGAEKEFNNRVEQRNTLKDMIDSLDKSVKNFVQPADLFNELRSLCPDSITLTGVTQDDTGLTLNGRSTDNAAVAQFIENLRTLKIFESVTLDETETGANVNGSTPEQPWVFEVKCLLPQAPSASATATPAPTATAEGGAGQ